MPIWTPSTPVLRRATTPEYRGRPLVVGALPGHRGVVAAATMPPANSASTHPCPLPRLYHRCPDAIYLPPDAARYSRVSRYIPDPGNHYLMAGTCFDEAHLSD